MADFDPNQYLASHGIAPIPAGTPAPAPNSMPFDPDTYLAQKSAPVVSKAPPTPIEVQQFDPDQYLAQKGSADYEADQALYGTLPQQGLAAVEGLGRGVSLGGSDLAEVKMGLTTPQALAGRARANPVTANAMNALGGAALIYGTGGLGALAEGGSAAARIAALAAEGGAFGAGNAVSDYAMGDPSLNAQKVAAYIGTGALFGAGLGALGRLTESYLPKAASKLQESMTNLREMAAGTAEEPGILDKIAPDWAKSFRDGMANGTLDPKTATRDLVKNLGSIVENAKQAANDLYEKAAPANIGNALREMPTDQAKALANQTVQKIQSLITAPAEAEGEAASRLLGPGNAKIVEGRLATLAEDLSKAKNPLQVHTALSDFAKELDKGKLIKFDTVPTAAQMADQEVLRNVRDAIRGDLSDRALWGDAAMHYSELNTNYAAYKNSLRNFQSSFMKREVGPGGVKRFIIDPTKVQSFFNNIDKVGQDLRKQYLNEFINQSANLAKASENYAGYIKGAEAISDHVEQLSQKNAALKGQAEAMAAGKGEASSSLGLGSWGAAGVAHTMGVPHPVTAAALLALKTAKAIKNPYQMGAGLANTLNKLHGLGTIIDKTSQLVAQGAKSIFTNNASRGAIAATAGVMSNASFEKNVKRIQAMATDPQALSDHLEKTTKNLFEAAPNISQGLHNATVAGVQFLNSKIPKPNTQLPLGQDWEATKSQKAQFNRYFQAVDDPIAVLKQVKDGSLSSEAMEALQAVHPDLLKEMQHKVIENMSAKSAKNINYATKIAVSKFIGSPVVESLMPQVIMLDQANFAMPPGQAAAGAPRRKSSESGLEKIDLSKRTATETQELEEEE